MEERKFSLPEVPLQEPMENHGARSPNHSDDPAVVGGIRKKCLSLGHLGINNSSVDSEQSAKWGKSIAFRRNSRDELSGVGCGEFLGLIVTSTDLPASEWFYREDTTARI